MEPTGDIQGDGKGGAFFVAKPDYTIMLGRQTINGGDDQTAYIVDGLGVSLYDFTNDEANVSNCSGGCAEAWPPFNTEDMILPSILSANDFDSFQREDELGYQVTFKGNPLYYFNNDNKTRGNVLGEGGANGQFFVVKPSL
ncbi:hypothetical protein LVD15_22215 [Fulvivirga maritima]|uniref:COG4315 family predicted lipoprotein n=1 Tax=Fulvivirga maritima TaxID=2904247 RepID=UPI001F16A5C6|nr:hypothetical protein [Fulvivirga maritima]UII25990.1 hypothetical protein LVD15_22215 [Fulvivirga maritima]